MKQKKILIVILSIIILLVIVGVSYAWLTTTILGKKEYIIKAGKLQLILDETSNGLQIQNAIPVEDSEGLKSEPATFNITNTSSTEDLCYDLYLDDANLLEGETRVEDKFVKYSLDKYNIVGGATVLTNTGINPNRLLDHGQLKAGKSANYKLRLWFNIDEDGYFEEQVFKGKLRLEATQCKITEDVEPPIITGGNNTWTAEPVKISVERKGNASSGIAEYEYYISNSKKDVPTENTVATGTTNNEIEVTTRGYSYVYYRSVSNNGIKSTWSNYQFVKYDDNPVELTVNPTTSANNKDKLLRITFNNEEIAVNDILEYEFSVPATPITVDFNDHFLCEDSLIEMCQITKIENQTMTTVKGELQIPSKTNYMQITGYRFFDFAYETAADRTQDYPYKLIRHRPQ